MSIWDVIGDIIKPSNWSSLLVDTNAVASESYFFWKPLVRLSVHAFALLGNEDGETSFRPAITGDSGTAFGMFQWHDARIQAMLAPPPHGCGIDVRTASHIEQLKAAYWEMNHAIGYRHVWEQLMATDTIWDAVACLVKNYEHSGFQARDITRRVALAQQWADYFKGQ